MMTQASFGTAGRAASGNVSGRRDGSNAGDTDSKKDAGDGPAIDIVSPSKASE